MPLVDYAGLKVALDLAFPDRDWSNKCEAFRYQATRLTNDLPMMPSFPSAKAARAQSKIIDNEREAATPGQVGWWDKTSYGYTMLALGNDVWVGATGLGDTIVDLGGGLKVITGASFPAPFIGRAEKVGNNPRALLLPWEVQIQHLSDGWAFNPPEAAIQLRIQLAMATRDRYIGKQNGAWGPLSIVGIQLTARNVGYSGPIDGAPNGELCRYIQAYATEFGGYQGQINGQLDADSWLGFCNGLEAGLV